MESQQTVLVVEVYESTELPERKYDGSHLYVN